MFGIHLLCSITVHSEDNNATSTVYYYVVNFDIIKRNFIDDYYTGVRERLFASYRVHVMS